MTDPLHELRALLGDHATTADLQLLLAAALRAASAEQHAAALQAAPGKAVAVENALRVAGPWEDRNEWTVVRLVRWMEVAEIEQYGVAGEESENWRWKVLSGFPAWESSGKARTKLIAMAAADAALTACGWSLA